MRGLTSQMLAEIVKPQVRELYFVEIAFDGGVERYTTHCADISWNGESWTSSSNLLQIGDIREDIEPRINTVTIELAGSGQASIARALSEDYTDREVNIWRGYLVRNSILNPSFESGVDPHAIRNVANGGTWTIEGAPGSYVIQYDSTGQTGTARLDLNGNGTVLSNVPKFLPASDGDRFYASAWIRLRSGDANVVQLGIESMTASGEPLGRSFTSASINSEWQRFQVEHTAQDGEQPVAYVHCEIRIFNSGNTGETQFDLIEFYPESTGYGDECGNSVVTLNAPIQVFSGRLDSFTLSEDPRRGTSTLTWTASNHFADFDRTNGRLANDEAHQKLYPGDEFFKFATRAQLQARTVVWGRYIRSGGSILRPSTREEIDRNRNRPRLEFAPEVGRIPVVYGTREVVGGIETFLDTAPANQDRLYIVRTLCEGEIDSVTDVLLDGVSYTDPRWNHPTTGSSLVTVAAYTGTSTQTAHAELVSAFPEYTSACRGLDTAYVVVRLTYHEDVFSSIPELRFIVKGRKVYDPRTDTTAYSDNPALCIRDYLTDSRVGKGLPASVLDGISEAADECDENSLTAPVTQAQFACSAVVDTDETLLDNLKRLLGTCRGYLPYTGGKYRLVIDKDDSPAFTFTPDVISGGWRFQTSGIRSRYNRVEATFTNPNRGWQQDVGAVDSASYREADNGRLLKSTFNMPYTTNLYRAQDQAEFVMNTSRQQLSTGFDAQLHALNVAPGDIVEITHPTPGWGGKTFRVTGITMKRPSDGPPLTFDLSEHEPNVYSLNPRDIEQNQPDTHLPDPSRVEAPINVAPESGEEHLIKTSDGSIVSRIYVQWNAVSDIYVTDYEIQHRLSSGGQWVDSALARGRDNTQAYVVGVEDLKAYDVRVRSRNVIGNHSLWTVVANHIVEGKSAPPPDVTNFLTTRLPDGTREYSWLHSRPIDHAGYTIRCRPGTGHTWEDMAGYELNQEGFIEHSPWESVRPLTSGMHTFAIKAIDRSGNESVNAAFIEADLGAPRIAGSLFLIDVKAEGWPGAKTDCHVDPISGDLVADNQGTWEDLPSEWSGWGVWNFDPVSEFVYEHDEIDFGAVLTVTPVVTLMTQSTAIVEMAVWNGSSYEDWEQLGPTTTDKIKLRVTIQQSSTEVPILSQMIINITANIVDEDIEDVSTSSLAGDYRIGTGDIRLPITKDYTLIRTVNVILQNVGPGWSWEIADKDTTVGPRVKIYNGSNAPADATIDAYVRGL